MAESASSTTDKAAKGSDEPRFSREEVLASAREITGYRRHLVAGALAGSDRKSYTRATARKAVEDFMKQADSTRKKVEK